MPRGQARSPIIFPNTRSPVMAAVGGGMACDPHFASVAELLNWDQDATLANNTNFGFSPTPSYTGFNTTDVAVIQGARSMITTGTGNHMDMAVWDVATNDHTVEVSVKFNGVVFPAVTDTTFHDLIANYNATTSNRSWLLGFRGDGSTNHELAFVRSENGVATALDVISLGQALVAGTVEPIPRYWITVERDGADLHFYLDGVLKGTVNIGAGYDFHTSGLNWRVGLRHDGGAVIASGRFDEFRFTRGVARYGGSSYTVEDTFPTIGC